jgi:putative transposase
MRHPRVVHPGFPHHIILRGNNRRRLFSYPRDFRRFLAYLDAATAHHDVALHDVCLMANHAHLIATPDNHGALSSWAQEFAQRYAQQRNKQRDATGKLFEQRFRSFPILDERYLEACTAYVLLNPVRAGLVRTIDDYPWSTYRLQAGKAGRSLVPPSLWTPSPFYLSLGRSTAERATAFADWIDGVYAEPAPVLASEHEAAARAAEELSEGYGRRLLRPNGTRCA